MRSIFDLYCSIADFMKVISLNVFHIYLSRLVSLLENNTILYSLRELTMYDLGNDLLMEETTKNQKKIRKYTVEGTIMAVSTAVNSIKPEIVRSFPLALFQMKH